MAKRFNWEVWRELFVRGRDDVTLKSISTGHDAPSYDTLRKRAVRENWQKQREEFRHNTTTKTREIVVDSLAQVKARQASLGKSFMTLAVQALSAMPKAPEDLAKMKVGDIVALAQLGADLELRAMGIELYDLTRGSIGDVTKLTNQEIRALLERIEEAEKGFAIGGLSA